MTVCHFLDHERNVSTGSPHCDEIILELAAEVRSRLSACGFEPEAALEIGPDAIVLRPFPGAEYRIEVGSE